jgi:hypothetical protein
MNPHERKVEALYQKRVVEEPRLPEGVEGNKFHFFVEETDEPEGPPMMGEPEMKQVKTDPSFGNIHGVYLDPK